MILVNPLEIPRKGIQKIAAVVSKLLSVTKNSNQCPLQDGIHRIWQCKAIKEKSFDDRYKIVNEKKLCFSCFEGSHQIEDCKMW